MLLPLAQAELESAGGKAAGLRQLLEHGLPVPPGFCLPFLIYRQALPEELPARELALRDAEAASRHVRDRLQAWQPSAELRAALEQAMAALDSGAVVVRSSASCEALSQPSAGLFSSFAGVTGLEELLQAVRDCWASLWEVPAWAGLRLADRWPGGEAMAVIVQIQIEVSWGGLLLTSDPAGESRLRVEAVPRSGAALAAGEQDPEVILLDREPAPLPASAPLPSNLLSFLRRSASQLEQALAKPLELEWAYDGRQPWLLQLRPTRLHAPPRAFPMVWRRPEEASLSWRWDREHNPDPLSPAHQSLIELLENRGAKLMVQGGYLYTAPHSASLVGAGEDLGAIWERLRGEVGASLVDLERRATDPLTRLEAALSFFCDFYASYEGPLGRARVQARTALQTFLAAQSARDREPTLLLGTENSTALRTEELWQLARRLRTHPRRLDEIRRLRCAPELEPHLERYGCLMQRWDLAAPSLAEEPAGLLPRLLSLSAVEEDPRLARGRAEQAATRAASELREVLPAVADRERFDSLLSSARLARRLEEDDDLLFASALGAVRRALLEAGRELVFGRCLARTDEIFLLTIPEVRGMLSHREPPRDLPQELERRRRGLEVSRQLVPPLTIRGDRLTWLPAPGRVVLHGAGVGGVARGAVRLARSLEELLGLEARGAVVVCPTVLPSLAVVLAEAAALVTDHGGLLSHAASLARELGVPAVVGTGTATRDLQPEEIVWVDGSRGLVVRES